MRRLFLFFFLSVMPIFSFAQGILDLHPGSEVLPRLLSARKPAENWDVPRGCPAWTLLQFSDIHGDTENLARIVTFRETYAGYIDAAIHCGDAVACYYDDPNPWFQVEGAAQLMNVVGNHDCWKGHKVWAESPCPYDASQEEAYALLLSPYIGQWGVVQPEGIDRTGSPHYKACYYYKDIPESGIRMVVLDCLHYGQAQHEWFRNVLSDAARKHLSVLGVQHYPAQSGLIPLESGFTDLDLALEPEATPPDGGQMERMSEEAFEAADAFIGEGGTFICWLGGHTHVDFLGWVRGHEQQLQVLVDKAGEGDIYMQEDRTRGTVNQDAFNLVTVNPSRNLLVVDRIGCSRDQYLRSKQLFVYDYLKRKVLVNE